MEFFTLLALVFLIKSTISVMDYIVGAFENMTPDPIMVGTSIKTPKKMTSKQLFNYWADNIRYLVTRYRDFNILLICATYLYIAL